MNFKKRFLYKTIILVPSKITWFPWPRRLSERTTWCQCCQESRAEMWTTAPSPSCSNIVWTHSVFRCEGLDWWSRSEPPRLWFVSTKTCVKTSTKLNTTSKFTRFRPHQIKRHIRLRLLDLSQTQVDFSHLLIGI